MPFTRLPTRPMKEFHISKWTPHLGDEVMFAGKTATGMEFPQGIVHRRGYNAHGRTGYVIGWIGKDLVVRSHGENSDAPPGHGYGDFWAPLNQWYLIEQKSTLEPPHVPPPGPYGSYADIEDVLQAWAKSKGLPPVPKFDIEEFIKGNPYMGEPNREETDAMRRRLRGRQARGR